MKDYEHKRLEVLHARFCAWFAKLDLGALEPYRSDIEALAWDNTAGVAMQDVLRCAKGTAWGYIDDPAFLFEALGIRASSPE